MYAFGYDKSNKIIYNNLLFHKYQVTQMTADPSQLFWPPTCGCYVATYFESTGTAINIKKETVTNSCPDFHE